MLMEIKRRRGVKAPRGRFYSGEPSPGVPRHPAGKAHCNRRNAGVKRGVQPGGNNKPSSRLEQNMLRFCPRANRILFNKNYPVTMPWRFATVTMPWRLATVTLLRHFAGATLPWRFATATLLRSFAGACVLPYLQYGSWMQNNLLY